MKYTMAKNPQPLVQILCMAFIITFSFMGAANAQNSLSTQEEKEGWKLLFDGKSLKGWHNFVSKGIGSAWAVREGAIHLDKTVKKDGGDVVTDDEFENFELSLEWKIAPCGNSGIMFN
ncbi:MAG: DUF1080 domain-containing protein, partial [Flammeovirgaceae bacterium]